jgi:hypothetical protein
MFDNVVSRFSKGANNETDQGIFSDLYVQNRVGTIHEYSQDFDQYVAGDWTTTLNGGSSALVAGDGGLLALTSAVSAIASIQKNPADFQLALGFRAWGRIMTQLDSLLGSTIFGLLNATTTPFTGASQTDGVYFTSAVTTGEISLNVAVGGVISTLDTGVAIVVGSPFTASFYYDGGVYAAAPNGRIVFQISGTGVTAKARGEIAVPASGTIAAFPGAVNITPTLGVNASTAVARVLTTDLLYFAKDRANINATPAF